MSELQFKTARSGGAGGQHVNKVASKVILNWALMDSAYLGQSQKDLLSERLKNRISKEGLLIMEASEDRSQLRNKEIVIKRFFNLLDSSLAVDKKRVPSKIPKSKLLARMDRKKKHAIKKQNRKPIQRDAD